LSVIILVDKNAKITCSCTISLQIRDSFKITRLIDSRLLTHLDNVLAP